MKINSPIHNILSFGCGTLYERNRIKISNLLLAAVLLPAAFSARSQQQTVEGAQLFLTQVAEQGGTTFQVDDGDGWNRVGVQKSYCQYYGYDTASGIRAGEHGCSDFKASTHALDARSLTSATSLSRCATQVKVAVVRGRAFTVKDGSGRDYWDVRLPPQPSSFDIDWAKVAEVRQDGSTVTVKGIKPAMRFMMASDSLAIRVAYAMEFLRTECDATSGTGF